MLNQTSDSVMVRPTAVACGFLALHLLAIRWDAIPMWGVDFLRYGPGWAPYVFIIAAVATLYPAVSAALYRALSRIEFDPWRSTTSAALTVAALGLVALVLFINFRSAIHLLGDGYLYVRELDAETWESLSRSDRAPLTFWLIRQIHWLGRSVWGSAETTYRIVSISSGVLYVFFAFVFSGRIAANRMERSIVLAFLLTVGYLELFFGYVENYGLLFPGMLLYVLLGYRALEDDSSTLAPAFVLGVLIALHLATASLVPSFLYVIWRRYGKPVDGQPIPMWVQGLLSIGAVPATFLVVLLVIGVDIPSLVDNLGRSHNLPLLTDPNFYQPYRLLSPAHLADFLNQFLLAAPAPFMVLAIIGRHQNGGITSVFLLVCALVPALLAIVANPEIGAYRDWDVLAIPALPLTVWAARFLVTGVEKRSHLFRTGYVVCVAALLHLGAWVYTNSDTVRAINRFEDLLKRSSLSKHARSYGWETMGIYYRGEGDSERALDAYLQALDADPDNPRHWFAAGTLQFSLGRRGESVEYLEKAVSLRPDMAEVHSNLGNVYSDLGRTDKAQAHFEKAIALEPGFADAHSNFGNLLVKMGRFAEAKESFGKALSLQPNLADVYFNLANTHLAMGEGEAALENYRRAIALDPKFEGAHLNLGNSLYDMRRYPEARKAFDSVLRLHPGSRQALFGIGNCLMGLRQPAAALKYFQGAVDNRPSFVEALSMVGDIHFMSGRFDLAAQSYREVIRLRPNFAEGHANLGNVYHGLGRNEEAVAHFLKAIDLRPDFAEAFYNLGVVQLKMDRFEETRKAFSKVLGLAPDYPEAAVMRAWLQMENSP